MTKSPMPLREIIVWIAIHAQYNKHHHNGFERGNTSKYDTCLNNSDTCEIPQCWWCSTEAAGIIH